jgi:hypothetical protein
MASHISFVISGLLLVIITIVVQSAPIEKIVQIPSVNHKEAVNQDHLKPSDKVKDSSNTTSTTTSVTTTVSQSSLSTPKVTDEKKDNKKKRYIDDDDRFDGLLDDEINEDGSYQLPYFKPDDTADHTLHAKIKEKSATIHDNADKIVDTDDSKIFSEIQMNSNELTDIVRRRRDVKLNDESNRRRKRALSPYDFYNTDSYYDPYADLIEQHQYVRPARSFAPLYWYPSVYERNIRSALAPSVHESSAWPRTYSDTIDDEDINESPVPIFDDEVEDENDYESNRYPMLLHSSKNPYDNLQLQQQYNTDDLPIDEDIEQKLNDDDENDDEEEQYRLFYQKERPYYTHYGPIETYF